MLAGVALETAELHSVNPVKIYASLLILRISALRICSSTTVPCAHPIPAVINLSMAVFYRDGDILPALPGGPYTNFMGHVLVNVVGGLAHMTGLDPEGGANAKAKMQ